MSEVSREVSGERESDVVVTPLDAALGAEVRCGDLSKIGPKGRARVRQAYLDHLVLVFPGQHLSEDEQISITHIFGAPEASVVNPAEGAIHQVVKIANQPGGALGSGDLRWHSDHSFHDRPLSASLLHAIEIPPEGGDTYFNNMYLALATLPPRLLERIRGLTIKNDISTNSAGEHLSAAPTDLRTSKGPSHPVIRTHPETGLNALYLGRRPYAYVNGFSFEDSEDLLNKLWAHAANPTFEYRHRWRVGDLVVWDNRAVMHRRDAFDESQRRVMHRTQCSGDMPIYDPKADTRGFHPRGSGVKLTTHAEDSLHV